MTHVRVQQLLDQLVRLREFWIVAHYLPIVGRVNGVCDTASNKLANTDDGISLRNLELQMCLVSIMLRRDKQNVCKLVAISAAWHLN